MRLEAGEYDLNAAKQSAAQLFSLNQGLNLSYDDKADVISLVANSGDFNDLDSASLYLLLPLVRLQSERDESEFFMLKLKFTPNLETAPREFTYTLVKKGAGEYSYECLEHDAPQVQLLGANNMSVLQIASFDINTGAMSEPYAQR